LEAKTELVVTMTTEQFFQLEPGNCFLRQAKEGAPKKEYRIRKKEGVELIAYPIGDPTFYVHFFPAQAPQLARVDGSPDTPVLSQSVITRYPYPFCATVVIRRCPRRA
jgi:hypothetical protein